MIVNRCTVKSIKGGFLVDVSVTCATILWCFIFTYLDYYSTTSNLSSNEFSFVCFWRWFFLIIRRVKWYDFLYVVMHFLLNIKYLLFLLFSHSPSDKTLNVKNCFASLGCIKNSTSKPFSRNFWNVSVNWFKIFKKIEEGSPTYLHRGSKSLVSPSESFEMRDVTSMTSDLHYCYRRFLYLKWSLMLKEID